VRDLNDLRKSMYGILKKLQVLMREKYSSTGKSKRNYWEVGAKELEKRGEKPRGLLESRRSKRKTEGATASEQPVQLLWA